MSTLVEVRNLRKHFLAQEGMFREKKTVRAVDGVSFSIQPGESFGLVGESGCGKSTLGRLILALEEPTEGEVLIDGKNIYGLRRRELRSLRRNFQVIFQDPFSSLNPRMTVKDILSEPFVIHGLYREPAERARRLAHLLDVVGLGPSHMDRHPHEFSGGQRQRIGIARALALNPQLIVADEPVSALDVSIQAQILNLLKDLQKEFHLTYLFISHDFSVVRHICTRVAVMYLGRLVEISEGEEIFRNPQHPYTEALLSAVPVPDPSVERRRKRILLSGDLPSPMSPPSGCHFHPRCRYAIDTCRTQTPPLKEVVFETRDKDVVFETRDKDAIPGHWAACPVLPFKERPSVAALVPQ